MNDYGESMLLFLNDLAVVNARAENDKSAIVLINIERNEEQRRIWARIHRILDTARKVMGLAKVIGPIKV